MTWFCKVSLDQVQFMSKMFELERLEERLVAYVATLDLPEAAAAIPIDVLRWGEMARGDAARVTGRSERGARDWLAKLVERGLLVSETAKGPVRLRFSVESADVLFPRLFGAQLG